MALNKRERAIVDDSLKIAELDKRIAAGERCVADLQKKVLDYYHFDKYGIDLEGKLAAYERHIPKDEKEAFQLEWHKKQLQEYLALGSLEDVTRRLIDELEQLAAYKRNKRELEERLEQAFAE